MARLRLIVRGKSYEAWEHRNRSGHRMLTKLLKCLKDFAILVWTFRLREPGARK
jgi:hypothetical protein